MRESERQKLADLLKSGRPAEEILEAMKPKRNNRVNKPPAGGISQSEASRQYNIPQTTISGWVLTGYVPVLLRTKKEVYIDEAALVKVIEVYRKSPGRGKKTVKCVLSAA